MIHQVQNAYPHADETRRPRAEAVFQPVAIPAVAAAVEAARTQPRQAPPQRDVPAILRKEAMVG